MSSKPRVLRIINRFNLGGPTYNACYLTKYLEEDFETMLIGGTNMESEESSLFVAHGLGLKPIVLSEMTRSVGLMNEVRAYGKISRIIQEFQPDIVHTHASKAGTLGRWAAHRNGVKHIVHTFHGHVFEGYFNSLITTGIIQIERYLAAKSDRIIAISERQRMDLAEKFRICPDEKVTVVPLGFELSRFTENQVGKRAQFRQEFKLQDNEVAIGIIGRLVPIKHHAFFLKSLVRLKQNNIRFRAFIVGDGELKQQLIRQARESGLGVDGNKPELIFTSWRKDMDVVIAGLDIVAMTSLNEGTPVSLIEAGAAGRAVISTNVGGVADVMIGDAAQFLIAKDDLDAFTEKLQRLIEDEDLRMKAGLSGQERIMSAYSVSRLAGEMKNLYFDLLKSKV